jgi:hypothetical protein
MRKTFRRQVRHRSEGIDLAADVHAVISINEPSSTSSKVEASTRDQVATDDEEKDDRADRDE